MGRVGAGESTAVLHTKMITRAKVYAKMLRMMEKGGRGAGMFPIVERVKGIEPSYAAWEAAVLPLNYAR